MKVLLINGSPRHKGNTSVALNEVATQLEKQGIETQTLWIGTKPMQGCVACGKCKELNNRCNFNNDVCNQVIEAMEQCDALVVGSPVYYGQPAGPLLSLLQRALYAGSGAFENKPFSALCVCRRGGSTAALQTLQMPFQLVHMPMVTSQYWNIVFGRTEGEAALDTEGMQTMRMMANNMAWMLKKLHGENVADKPERETPTPMHFIR